MRIAEIGTGMLPARRIVARKSFGYFSGILRRLPPRRHGANTESQLRRISDALVGKLTQDCQLYPICPVSSAPPASVANVMADRHRSEIIERQHSGRMRIKF